MPLPTVQASAAGTLRHLTAIWKPGLSLHSSNLILKSFKIVKCQCCKLRSALRASVNCDLLTITKETCEIGFISAILREGCQSKAYTMRTRGVGTSNYVRKNVPFCKHALFIRTSKIQVQAGCS